MGTPLPTGPVFRINPIKSYSVGQRLATLEDGTFAVVWSQEVIETVKDPETGEVISETRYSTVRGQVFYANGDKLGEEFVISSLEGDHAALAVSDVVALKDGGFAVSYGRSPDGAFENTDTLIRVYKADRSAGAEIVATRETEGWQSNSVLTALDDGGFMLSYQTSTVFGEFPTLMTQRYDANGGRLGASKPINLSSDELQSFTTLKNGNVVLAYFDEAGELRSHIYTPNGLEVTPENGIILPSTRDDNQVQPSITALVDGRFVAVWTQSGGTGEDPFVNSIRGRIFTSDGTPVGNDFQINVKTQGSQRLSSVAALPNGGFAVAFEDWDFGDGSPSARVQSIRVVAFKADGTRDGDEVLAVTGGFQDVQSPQLSALADGRLLLTWTELNGSREPHGAAQVLDPRVESLNWSGSDNEDNYVGTVFDDTLKGMAGKDRLYGNNGSDTLDGGVGADSLDGGAGLDLVSYAAATSRVDVDLAKKAGAAGEATGDVLTAIEGIVGSAFNDKLTGDDLANLLKGGSGNDDLQAGADHDEIWGGAGNDSLKGGAGRDVFVFDTKANTKTNRDKIADFKTKDDSIWLDNKVFAKLGKKGTEDNPAQLGKVFFTIGTKAKDKNDYVIYDKAKGVLLYDADGSGKGKAVEIAALSKKLAMTYKDFFVI
ncbi:Ca2+-binding RTX toxin-like protein [Microvirga lupini]|uniref:Ca2+-binding RTX toxin-like protein n=1 Tax=Microvirga lupini TaxID=420324 RepID=A0A7W4VHW3_9HYPH|nr:Ca2+-binding RTX toxin-like protein [Microvirga lupini]